MDKEIIIDDVDVAGCANLDSLICNCGVICKGRDCYYKQLKRLEQKYNEVLKLAKDNADSNEYIIQELEKENEELKSLLDFEVQKAETCQQKNEDLKEKLGNTEVLLANAESDLKFEEERTNELEKENKELKEKAPMKLIAKNNNYRSALEEIRKITKKYDADAGDTIIANPIQDCYDIYCLINKVLESEEQNER